MKKGLILAGLAASLVCNGAFANSETGKDLIQQCGALFETMSAKNLHNIDPTTVLSAGMCIGFIDGVSSTLSTAGIICSQTNRKIDRQDLIQTVTKDARLHPEMLDKSRFEMVSSALVSAYPCKDDKK